MGCVSSCFRVEDYEDYTNPSSSINRNCPCPRCFVNSLLNLYITLFRRNETRSLPSSLQATTVSITSSSSYDNFMSNTPRPLPYDADPGYFRSRRVVSRRDKGSCHSLEEAEPLRSDAADVLDSESFSIEGSKWATASKLFLSTGEDSKEDFSKSTRRFLKSKSMDAFSNDGVYVMSDDEDVCPTCLEEYTSENPKIVTKCSHHFHLGCIYEWMERSEDCPVCGKVMEFNETP
ncbi:RING/U-box superfamily protein [Hirschfeldia incana]|nr:RING/U-box superfamily protein [Hirschfeldia incana]